MNPQAIFVPVAVLALWTGLVLMLTGLRRVVAVRRGRIKPSAFALGESPDVPVDVLLMNRNLMNLLEMPVLFYVVALASFVTGHVKGNVLPLSWTYVGLRFLHSLIHVTYNRVIHRLVVFSFSNGVLLALWIGFLRQVLRSL